DVALDGGDRALGDDDGEGAPGGGEGGDAGTLGPVSDAGVANIGDACAAQATKASLADLDLYVIEDQSGSMNDNNKWTSVKDAFTTFVQSPSAAGIGMGIQYFALTGTSTCTQAC